MASAIVTLHTHFPVVGMLVVVVVVVVVVAETLPHGGPFAFLVGVNVPQVMPTPSWQ